ncbi:MAG: PQQ-binding-like beta-propeller repeat protein [Ginsengibacter sp.]
MIHNLYSGFYLLLPGIICCIAFNSCNNGPHNTDNRKTDTIAIRAMGKEVFTTNCQACHGNPAYPKAPSPGAFSAMEPKVILNALDNGKMRQQASSLTQEQREAVAQYITNKMLKTVVMPDEAYTHFSLENNGDSLYDYSGWGGDPEGTGFRTTQQAGITPQNVSTLQLKWSFAFPDESDVRCKPAFVGDWLIVGSQNGEVYALNRKTGKIGWHVTAATGLRSSIIVNKEGNNVTAYFVDGSTNTYAVDVKKGKILWSVRAGVDPLAMNTGTPVVYGEKIFVPISSVEVAVAADSNYNCCTSSGGVAALDIKTGNFIWYHRVITDTAIAQGKKSNGKSFYGPAGAPVWCSPSVDAKRNLLYIGTGENYTLPATNTSDAIQALDMSTGKLVWNFQATQHDAWNLACPVLVNCPGNKGRDLDFGMAPILVTGQDGKQRLLVGQKAGVVYALSPDDGNLLWKTRIGKGGALGGIHWGMATDGKNVYAANADNTLALDPDDTTRHASPGIYALTVITGKVVWSAAAPAVPGKESYLAANSSAPAAVPGVVFAGSNDGHIRAYSTTDGVVLWDYNTIQKYKTVNGIDGNGGSIDSPAPVTADGMLYVNSGYAQFGEKAGNVLLAFEVKK